ncbi:MAG: hypothetical protein R3B09_05230 [Nannocystaceae bacterium]
MSTPAERRVIDGVTRLRFTTWDGQRGVLTGHEPARALVGEAAIELTIVDARGGARERFLACEEGLAEIDPRGVEIAARWAAEAGTLGELRALVTDRARTRATIEAEAKALALRHEVALHEAMSRLVRRTGG